MAKRTFYWFVITMIVILAAGFVLTAWTVDQQDRSMRERMLIETRLASAGISPAQVQALSGSPADLNSPDYQEMKTLLMNLRADDPDIRFTYLIGKRPDGMYFFYVDSEPPASPDYSPPGQDYPEAPAMVITTFSTGQEMTGGPDSDRWGTWVSGAIPVTDPETGKTIALFGMDIDARNWNRQLAIAALPVIAGILILLILVGAFFILHERDEKERRRIIESDKAIRESEERYRLLFTHSPIGIVQVSRDGVIEMVNDKFGEIIGVAPDRLRGFDVRKEIRDPAFLAAGRAAIEGKIGSFEGIYTSVITGRSVVLRMVTQPLGSPDTGYSGVMAIVEDVTERKKAEEALEESKANVEAILESTDDIIASYDPEIRLIAYNKACADVYRSLFGVEISPGLRTVDLFPESQRDFWNRNNTRALAGESFSTEFSLPSPDGPVRIFESFFRPIRKGSDIAGFSTFTRDITRRKQAEFALAEVTRKLSLLNYVTFNDIENSVFVIDGFVSLLRSDSEEQAGEYLDYIKDSLRKVQKSLSFAKDYQHLGETVPQWQNVNQSFVFGISHLDFSSIERDSRVGNLEIFASPLLERVFFALGKNVISHATGATKVTLDYTESENRLLLRFRDNGPGIPAEKKEEIFERGYGRQKGMELFLVREILGITGITIHETGVYGEGACFELVIPQGAYRFADPE